VPLHVCLDTASKKGLKWQIMYSNSQHFRSRVRVMSVHAFWDLSLVVIAPVPRCTVCLQGKPSEQLFDMYHLEMSFRVTSAVLLFQRTGILTLPSVGPGWTVGNWCTTTAMWPPIWQPTQQASRTGPLPKLEQKVASLPLRNWPPKPTVKLGWQ